MSHVRKRVSLFFFIAILLPAATLILLARQVIRQDAELARARAAAERQVAVEQFQRELSARLDALVLQEINRRLRSGNSTPPDPSTDSAIVLVTTLNGERMLLPWETTTPSKAPTPAFVDAHLKGEGHEFIDRDFIGALGDYRTAVSASRNLREKCQSRLMVARVLVKTSGLAQASKEYGAIVKECNDLTDDFGMPFGLYAAERLVTLFKDFNSMTPVLSRALNHTRWVAPQEAYMVRDLLNSSSGSSLTDARKENQLTIDRIERLAALARDFPRIRPISEESWVAYGDEPWLVSIPRSAGQAAPLVFVVSSKSLKPPLGNLTARNTPGSAPLGDGFSGLRVEWQANRFSSPQGIPASLVVAGLALILGITILGGYLFLRDIHRDLRVAELRTHFVASVSHELKTPLTSIRMFAETLSLGRTPDDRTRSEYLDTIMNESERLARLVDNVLDFSKIEQGRKVYRMRTTQLPDVVRSAARAMQYPLAQFGFTLKVFVEEKIPALEADTDAVEQAILNLLSNAMKYSAPPSQIELRLLAQGADAVVEVTDHGVGIPHDEQTHIFEKFYRVRSTQTESVAGTGLGLTLVKHIAEAHGGRVDVRSAVGAGSTFSIRLPLQTTEATT
jgi:signal transduction histidine kinase